MNSTILKKIDLQVDANKIPEIIGDNFKELNNLEKKIIDLNQKVTDLKIKADDSLSSAKSAKHSANVAKGKDIGWFFNWGIREAVEYLQTAMVDVSKATVANADSLITSAEAQKTTIEVLKLSFEYQKELANFSKQLFLFSALSIANNRMIVRELELRLKGASKEKLNDLAKQELFIVLKQLKAQEDVMIKQEQLKEIVKTHDKKLDELSASDELKLLEFQAQKNTLEHFKELLETRYVKNEHIAELLQISDDRQKELLKSHIETDERHEAMLQVQIAADKRHEELFEIIFKTLAETKYDPLSKWNNYSLISKISLAIGALALIGAVVNFFI